MRNRKILLTNKLLLGTALVLGVAMLSVKIIRSDQLLHSVDAATSRTVSQIKEVETNCDQILSNIFYQVDQLNKQHKLDSLELLTEISIKLLLSYRISTGMCFHFQSGLDTYIYKLSDSEFLRVLIYEGIKEVEYENIRFVNQKLISVRKWRSSTEKMDPIPEWQNGTQLKLNQMEVSKKFYSVIVQNYIHIFSKRMEVFKTKIEAVGIMISLEALTHNLLGKMDETVILIKNIEGPEVFVVDNFAVNMIIGDESSPFLIKNPEVDKFLDDSQKRHFQSYVPKKYYYNGNTYIGKWITFRIANRSFKLGVIQKQSWDILFLIYFIILTVIILVVLYLLTLLERSLSKVYYDANEIQPINYPVVQEEEHIVHWKEIKELLFEDAFYLKPECTLPYIAQQSGYSRDEILEAVQQNENKTFKEYISDLRINSAVHYFENPESQDYSIDHLAGMFGYNSRTTFYREFKKRTGYSPAEFQLLHKNKE